MNKTLSIPRTLANRLLTLAQSAPDTEICGLISKSASHASKRHYHVYPVDNVATDAGSLFEMAPQQQIRAFKSIREKNETLFAIYHSHPHSAAIPSEKDLKGAAYSDDALNIIISSATRGVLEIRGYFYEENTVEAVELVVD